MLAKTAPLPPRPNIASNPAPQPQTGCQAPNIATLPMLAFPPSVPKNTPYSISLSYTSKMLALRFPNLPKVPGTQYFASPSPKPHFRAKHKGLHPKICVPGTLLEAEIRCQAPCFWVPGTMFGCGMLPATLDALIVQRRGFGGNRIGFASEQYEKSGRESEITCRFCLLFQPPARDAKGPYSSDQLLSRSPALTSAL